MNRRGFLKGLAALVGAAALPPIVPFRGDAITASEIEAMLKAMANVNLPNPQWMVISPTALQALAEITPPVIPFNPPFGPTGISWAGIPIHISNVLPPGVEFVAFEQDRLFFAAEDHMRDWSGLLDDEELEE